MKCDKKYIEHIKSCSWPKIYYGIFSRIINENNFKKCAEVGIGYGLHAKHILDNTNLEKLYLVDPLIYYPGDGFVQDVKRLGGFEFLFKNIGLYLKDHKERYIFYRKKSLDITNNDIQDDFLDAVFIDGDHSYEAVIKDLDFWWNKLKRGGWLLGDDYKSVFPGVSKAVDEFADKHNLKIEFLFKDSSSGYPIYKFIKD